MVTGIQQLVSLSLLILLAGCKLTVTATPGGDVESASGTRDCVAGKVCAFDMSAGFNETFMATAKPGYRFVKWQNGTGSDKGGFLCGESTDPTCTVALPNDSAGAAVAATKLIGYLLPVFCVDTDNDSECNGADPDDDNDGILDADDEGDFDEAALGQIATDAQAMDTYCLLVAKDGVIAREWYFASDVPRAGASATKSITSILIGIAADDGSLSLDDSAASWIQEWQGTASEVVTVRDLLSNASGRQWSYQIDYFDRYAAPDQTAFSIGLGQDVAPGVVWTYNNSAIQTLERVLKVSTGQDVAAFAQSRLFGPLGMTRTSLSKDGSGSTLMTAGVTTTCRDMYRFGQALLDDGAGIVSPSYLEAATGAPSTELNSAYGYLFWLNHFGQWAVASTGPVTANDPNANHGRKVEGAPEDMYWAIGSGGQIVQVDPGSNTVVVRMGSVVPGAYSTDDTARFVTEALH